MSPRMELCLADVRDIQEMTFDFRMDDINTGFGEQYLVLLWTIPACFQRLRYF
jgi:hypothetical protein